MARRVSLGNVGIFVCRVLGSLDVLLVDQHLDALLDDGEGGRKPGLQAKVYQYSESKINIDVNKTAQKMRIRTKGLHIFLHFYCLLLMYQPNFLTFRWRNRSLVRSLTCREGPDIRYCQISAYSNIRMWH